MWTAKQYTYNVYFHGVPVEACPLHRKLFNHHIASGIDSKVSSMISLSRLARRINHALIALAPTVRQCCAVS